MGKITVLQRNGEMKEIVDCPESECQKYPLLLRETAEDRESQFMVSREFQKHHGTTSRQELVARIRDKM